MSAIGTTVKPNSSESPQFSPKKTSRVREVAPARSRDALDHFSRKLQFETDCADVFAAFASDTVDFVLVDVRSRKLFDRGHVPGAISIPLLNITSERLREFPLETVFVVYCAGPHCNGANKAAIRIAEFGRPVKEMIGGITGWGDEGFSLAEEGS
jgi:rhodanese-related sulfurtransferase